MKNGIYREHNPTQHQPNAGEAEFFTNFGIVYRTIEEHIERFAKEAGPAHSIADITDRVGELLRLKAKNVRAQHRASELLFEMRENGQDAGEGARYRAGFEARPQVHVRARSGKALKGRRSDFGRPQEPERLERIRKMLMAGMRKEEIGKALGVTAAAIYHQIKNYHLEEKQEVRRSNRVERIRELLESGMTRQEVGDTVGITKDGVGYFIRQYKLNEPARINNAGRKFTVKPRQRNHQGKHWTQLPKNRAKMKKWAKKMRRAKQVAAGGTPPASETQSS